MRSNSLISVIIPSFNSARFVVQAVQSALVQTYSPVEIIVVDDGSNDDTRVALSPFFDRIRYVYQSNAGLSKARNHGIKEARGDLIAFLDADDWWLPEKLAKQWDCLKANPSAGLIHTDTYQQYEPGGTQSYVDFGKARFSGSYYSELFWCNRITISSVMVTRSCLDKIGLFDEEIVGPTTQDFDLWMRIARYYLLAYVNEPLVIYRRHGTSGSQNQRLMLEDEYYVRVKALKTDPALWQLLGHDKVRQWMFGNAFEAGYSNVDADDLPRARYYFREALSYNPRSIMAWSFLVSTFLPLELRKEIRRLKRWATCQP
jgi:glycosyltransferase involved in cell wall biosynthesis